MTHFRLLEGGVMVSCVTLPGNKALVPIMLLNSSNKKIVLEEDLCLAHLELVEMCGEISTPVNIGSEVRRLKVIELSNDEKL